MPFLKPLAALPRLRWPPELSSELGKFPRKLYWRACGTHTAKHCLQPISPPGAPITHTHSRQQYYSKTRKTAVRADKGVEGGGGIFSARSDLTALTLFPRVNSLISLLLGLCFLGLNLFCYRSDLLFYSLLFPVLKRSNYSRGIIDIHVRSLLHLSYPPCTSKRMITPCSMYNSSVHHTTKFVNFTTNNEKRSER